MSKLIIVESPSKARTLGKFLGAGYTIKASMGHVRDLPKSRLGVAVDAAFEPEYEVTKDAQVKELRQAAKRAESVLLASDPDREGEAIAWHLAEALGLRDPERVVFHEITKGAVEAALRSPRKIDRDLVFAQEARRVIDRLVGYQLSPLLWKKVSGGARKGLSAGRVQSVAVRLVVDREREIEAFVTEESWTVDALLRTERGEELSARLFARRGDVGDDESQAEGAATDPKSARAQDGSRLVLADEAAALEVIRALGVDGDGMPGRDTAPFVVGEIVARQTTRNPPQPYTTSTLQQDASTRMRFAPSRTMRLAQQLYEGVDLGADGPVGLITYMRTDSTRISPLAREAAVDHITTSYGKEYVGPGGGGRAKAKAAVEAQDAHEGIRPTDPSRTPESIASHLSEDQRRVYELIWRRFTASQMAPARFDTTRVDIGAADFVFRASGSVLRFDGFTRVLRRDRDEEDRSLPALERAEVLALRELRREQHFTQPPARFTEASLIKELEERGVGRPSTYASIMETIQDRKYVLQEERRLHPTALGVTVDGVLRANFPDIVDVDFTAEMEKRLDSIEEGSRGFEPTIREWYGGFAAELAAAETGMERVRVPVKETGETCPECSEGQLVIREGKYGEFVGCSRYPDCKYIKKEAAEVQHTGEACPECGKELVVRVSRYGKAFIGCSGYPECKHIKGDATPTGELVVAEDLGACPQCGKALARRMSRRGPFVGCTGYPGCSYIQPRQRGGVATGGPGGPAAGRAQPQPAGRDCAECGKPLLVRMSRFGRPFIGCSGYPKCRHTENEVNAETAPAADLSLLVAPPDGRAPDGDGSGATGDSSLAVTAEAGDGDTAASPVPSDLGSCPDCGKPLVERKGKWGPFVSCSGYPACSFRPGKKRAAATSGSATG